MDLQRETYGILKGEFYVDGFGVLSGRFTAKVISGMIVLSDEYGKEGNLQCNFQTIGQIIVQSKSKIAFARTHIHYMKVCRKRSFLQIW